MMLTNSVVADVMLGLAAIAVIVNIVWSYVQMFTGSCDVSGLYLSMYPPSLWLISLGVAIGFGAPAWVYPAIAVAVAIHWVVFYLRLRTEEPKMSWGLFLRGYSLVVACLVFTKLGMALG